MLKSLAISAIAAAATFATIGAASACPNGYKAVWIQGHKICQIDASASNTLTSQPKREPTRAAVKKTR